MAWADDFDITMPNGDIDTIDTGDDQICADKRAIQERLAWVFGFAASGETDNLKLGVNRVPFNENTENPVAVANQIILFAKEAASKAELFMIDEDFNARQLTSGGSWIGGMEKEVKMWFGAIADLPAGVYLCNGEGGRPDLRNQFIICAQEDDAGVAKTELDETLYQTGGATTHGHSGATETHILTIAEMPSHQHTIPTMEGYASGTNYISERNAGSTGDTKDTTKVGGGAGHAHDISSDSHLPPFYALALVSTYNEE